MHGGGPKVTLEPVGPAYKEENLPLLRKGLDNLLHHIKIAKKYGIPVVVAVNRFFTDSDAELELVRKVAIEEGGAFDAVVSNHWEEGGKAQSLCGRGSGQGIRTEIRFQIFYPLNQTIKEKIEVIAREVYGADGVDFSPEAEKGIEEYTRLGLADLPICMAKTHLSLSHDPNLKGVPKGFRIPVREVRISAGAGFIYPLLGTMSTMPGLPTRPAFMDIDIDPATGKILGLS